VIKGALTVVIVLLSIAWLMVPLTLLERGASALAVVSSVAGVLFLAVGLISLRHALDEGSASELLARYRQNAWSMRVTVFRLFGLTAVTTIAAVATYLVGRYVAWEASWLATIAFGGAAMYVLHLTTKRLAFLILKSLVKDLNLYVDHEAVFSRYRPWIPKWEAGSYGTSYRLVLCPPEVVLESRCREVEIELDPLSRVWKIHSPLSSQQA
jgi:hypothetical protein